ncbi:hypothetical protein LCGC14_0429390 [marine sediment metagenome]|uniref:Uncharacterized protein n=1 Tax=marine sediment metagenome TaxID=412755 RepID=A0A0F9SUG9_9ZZZZ
MNGVLEVLLIDGTSKVIKPGESYTIQSGKLMKSILVVIAGIAAIYLLETSLEITTAAAEVGRWKQVIVSNKTVLFFFNLIMIALIGGLISSQFKHRRVLRITVMMITWMVIYSVGFGTSQITTLPTNAVGP